MTREETIKWLKVEASYIEEDVGNGKEILEAYDMAIEALEQEPCEDATLKDIFCMGCEYKEQEPCEDCISRQAVIEWLKDKDILKTKNQEENARRELAELPPVTPQPKTGRWIDGKCNRCGTHAPYWAMASTYYCSEYCPNCGAKMEVMNDDD